LDYSLQLREGIRRYCVESRREGNICNLAAPQGQTYTVVTKSGVESFNFR
jgi:hypothetical protein